MHTASASNPASRLATLPLWDFDAGIPTLGFLAAQWAEANLIQPNGPRAGKPFRLTKGQLNFLLWFYALDEKTGAWLFDHAVRRLAKGSGKSPFAAVISLIEFCAPVRLERFDDRELGSVRGRPVDMPLVQIVATAESQTANTMRMVRAFAPKGSSVVDDYRMDPGKMKYYKLPEGTLEVITSSATAAEGAEGTFTVADETEHWKPSNGGPELADTLQDNLSKSGSRMLETANAWVPGIESVAEATWEAWLAQEEGRLKEGAGKILYDARLAPPDTDLSDPESLKAALQWVYGDCDWKQKPNGEVDVTPIIGRIWSPRAKPSESKRKYLNWPTVHEEAFVDPAEWARIAQPREVSETEDIVLFFDGSKSRDATAFIACAVSDGHVFVPQVFGRSTIWEPDPGDDDDVVPVDEVDLGLTDIFSKYNVVAFFADVKEWESFTKIEWPRRFGDRLATWAVPAGKSQQLIAWDMRTHLMDFTREVELVEDEIKDGLFTHDDNPILARHVANMRRRPNRYGMSVGKDSPSSPLKIDAGIAMIGARMVRRRYMANHTRRRSGVIW